MPARHRALESYISWLWAKLWLYGLAVDRVRQRSYLLAGAAKQD